MISEHKIVQTAEHWSVNFSEVGQLRYKLERACADIIRRTVCFDVLTYLITILHDSLRLHSFCFRFPVSILMQMVC